MSNRFSQLPSDDALAELRWCQALAAGSGVQINDLDESFADGRAFCAIMEALSPNSIDVAGLSTEDRRGNFELAFGISESKLDQIPLLDVEYVAGRRPAIRTVLVVSTDPNGGDVHTSSCSSLASERESVPDCVDGSHPDAFMVIPKPAAPLTCLSSGGTPLAPINDHRTAHNRTYIAELRRKFGGTCVKGLSAAQTRPSSLVRTGTGASPTVTAVHAGGGEDGTAAADDLGGKPRSSSIHSTSSKGGGGKKKALEAVRSVPVPPPPSDGTFNAGTAEGGGVVGGSDAAAAASAAAAAAGRDARAASDGAVAASATKSREVSDTPDVQYLEVLPDGDVASNDDGAVHTHVAPALPSAAAAIKPNTQLQQQPQANLELPLEKTVTVGLPLKMTFKGTPAAGYFVTKVVEGGNAAGAGIVVGSRIIAVNNISVTNLERKQVTETIVKSAGGIACDLRIAQQPLAFATFMRTCPGGGGGGSASTAAKGGPSLAAGSATAEQLAAAAAQLRLQQEVQTLVITPPLGMGFESIPPHGCFVTKCTPGSEAARHGVLVGRRIVSVNGVQTAQQPKHALLPVFKRPGPVSIALVEDVAGWTIFRPLHENRKRASAEPRHTVPPQGQRGTTPPAGRGGSAGAGRGRAMQGRGGGGGRSAAAPQLTSASALYGWLTKQPERIGLAHKRFFIFVPKIFKITYYKCEEDAAARQGMVGQIEITGQTTVAVDNLRLTVSTLERVFKLDAESNIEAKRWSKKLTEFICAARGLQQKIET